MSNLAMHVNRLANDSSYGRCLEPEVRRGCLIACAARLIAGEYELDATPALPAA
ncbi:TPA: hypothetical protein U2T46_000890 [Burkholderia cenocepacia]|nr:hypothetical protein [Burkholderia cenocepacia]